MKPTLLIVDDEKTTREGLRAALEERYDTYIAEDARAAMRHSALRTGRQNMAVLRGWGGASIRNLRFVTCGRTARIQEPAAVIRAGSANLRHG